MATSFHTLMGSAYYLHQLSSTTMSSGVTDQSQISTSAASYPGALAWDITGNTEKNSSSLGDFTLAVTDQHTAASSMFMAAQYDKTADSNNMVPLYPSLSARLAQGTPSQIPNQGHSLSLPYQQGSQVYYYNQGTLGSLLYGELGSCLQSYGSVSYTGSRASVQPEMVMVLKEIQSTNIQPPASTSGIYYPVPAQPITETSFQGMETSLVMKNSLRVRVLRKLKKTQVNTQKPESSAEKECPSPSHDELPPPGKVKLIPLPFSAWDKPQARPAPWRPAPYKTSSRTSLHRQPVPPVVTKRQSPPKLQTPLLVQDFSKQPVPWRQPNVPEPVMSKPIEQEQRPEREAMKRRAQQERDNAAKYTSLGKLQFFIEREKEMEIADYYGYLK